MDYKKLKEARIGIAGAGGLGSNVAVSLARIGVGNLTLVDFDRVEESNLNRQYFFRSQLGAYKVDALKENILAISKDINIETYKEKIDSTNIDKFFSQVDILVEALDDPNYKALLISEFLSKYPEKKLVGASGIEGYRSSNTIKTKRMSKNFYLVGDGVNVERDREIFLAPRVILAASHQANMVLRLILNKEEV